MLLDYLVLGLLGSAVGGTTNGNDAADLAEVWSQVNSEEDG
jgi:hypothetical protein